MYSSEGIHSGFEAQGRLHKKSNTGVPVGPEKDLIRVFPILYWISLICRIR